MRVRMSQPTNLPATDKRVLHIDLFTHHQPADYCSLDKTSLGVLRPRPENPQIDESRGKSDSSTAEKNK